jgi:hypothetical protein
MSSLVSRVVAAVALMPALALAAPPPASAEKKPEPAQATAPAKAPAKPSKQYTIDQFMATTKLAGASFSPDE